MKKALLALAAVVVLLAGGLLAFVLYRQHESRNIRGSSTERSHAIQADILTQLSLARAAVAAAHEARRLPALDELDASPV